METLAFINDQWSLVTIETQNGKPFLRLGNPPNKDTLVEVDEEYLFPVTQSKYGESFRYDKKIIYPSK